MSSCRLGTEQALDFGAAFEELLRGFSSGRVAEVAGAAGASNRLSSADGKGGTSDKG